MLLIVCFTTRALRFHTKIWSIPLSENSILPNITKKLSVCLASTNLERKWAFRQQARHGRRPNSRLVTPPPICTANVTSWPQGTNYFVTAVHRCCWRLFYLVLLYTLISWLVLILLIIIIFFLIIIIVWIAGRAVPQQRPRSRRHPIHARSP